MYVCANATTLQIPCTCYLVIKRILSYLILSFMVPTTGISHGICLRSYFWPSREAARAVGVMQIFVNMIMPFVVHGVCYARILAVLRMRVSPNENSTINVQTSCNMTSTIERNPEMIVLESGTKQFLDPYRNGRRNTKVDHIPSHCSRWRSFKLEIGFEWGTSRVSTRTYIILNLYQ